jgi:group I intron endonuclease
MTTGKETWILYQTTNICNGKIYVGVHKVADTSRSKRYVGSGQAIKAAIKKYGRDNFVRKTLAEFSCAKDAYAAEADAVNENFVGRDDTYNLNLGGKGCNGLTHTDEAKAKMSISAKGRITSAETRAKIGDKSRNRVISEETRAKMSISAKGKTLSENTKAKIAAAKKGKTPTEETRAKISAALNNPETKAKMSAASKGNKNSLGKVASEETRAKQSAAKKGKKLSGEHRAKISEAGKGRIVAEETRDKLRGNKWNIGRYPSEETKLKRSLNSPKRKPVIINGNYYISGRQAAKLEQVTVRLIQTRVKNLRPEWSEYRFATEEEIANFSAGEVEGVGNLVYI